MMLKSKADLKPYSSVGKSPDLKGKWTNELGATMEIQSSGGGKFAGQYTSAVSAGGNPVSGSLSGVYGGDAISFVVTWQPTYNSTTSWSGLILADDSDRLHLYTLWHLAETPDKPSDWWESILAGSDRFWKLGP